MFYTPLKCKDNYILKNDECIENEAIPILKSEIINELLVYLKNENGDKLLIPSLEIVETKAIGLGDTAPTKYLKLS